jgi:3-oxoacyl-[acyl-carrier-protein] synthase-3
MAQATSQVVESANLTIDDINLIIPHQANRRIIESAARGLKLPLDRFAINVDRYGNTSTASIPIATVEAIEQGRLQKDNRIVFVGFGAGLTWGAAAIHWTGPFPSDKKIYPKRIRKAAKLRSALRRTWRRVEGIIYGR